MPEKRKFRTQKTHPSQAMHPEQVQNLLKFIDASQSDSVKESIFHQLGYECFYARKLDEWIGSYKEDVQSFLDWVNIEKASRYWERLEFTEDGRTLILTGKKVEGCVCAFADCVQPPRSLCTCCCKNFQQEMFGTLLGQKVAVEITEAFLLGGERCSTRIHLR